MPVFGCHGTQQQLFVCYPSNFNFRLAPQPFFSKPVIMNLKDKESALDYKTGLSTNKPLA